jgi:hypothetical protein
MGIIEKSKDLQAKEMMQRVAGKTLIRPGLRQDQTPSANSRKNNLELSFARSRKLP